MHTRNKGFSLIEMIAVTAIILILAGIAIPSMINMLHSARLHGTGSDLVSLVQQSRIRAVQDDRFYSVRFNSSQAYVDICPQSSNGTSGNAGAGIAVCTPATPPRVTPKDPIVQISAEISLQPSANAPNTGNGAGGLQKQFLGTNTSNLVPFDGDASSSPVTFGPEGVPCTPTAKTGGTVCNTNISSPLVAFWLFFQDTATQQWGAVTVTPAGRIQKWFYSGGAWSTF